MSTFMENRKLTICLLGSAESIHMLKWAKYFSKKGHKVHLISYVPLIDNYDLEDIQMHWLKRFFPIKTWPFNTILNMPASLIKLKKLIEEIKPDIVNSHYITSYGTLSVLLNFHPLVMTAWGSDILITPQKFLPSKWAVKYALTKADLITCDAEHMKKAMIELGADGSKIRIINFGIDTKKFSPGPKDEKFKKELRIFGFKTVISLRDLEPIYDIETLIKAIPFVLKEVPKTKFIIISTGSQEEGLKRLAKDLEIKENIKFLGTIPNEELPKYFRISDVYVSTSLSDAGIAACTSEAMACELPVVITDSGENKEWVQDNQNGFLIPIKAPKMLAERIVYLLKNENLRKKFGEKNRKVIKEKNDYYKEMAKMEDIYINLAKEKKNS